MANGSGIGMVVYAVFNSGQKGSCLMQVDGAAKRAVLHLPRVGDHVLLDWDKTGRNHVLAEVVKVVLTEDRRPKGPEWSRAIIFFRVPDDTELSLWSAECWRNYQVGETSDGVPYARVMRQILEKLQSS